MEVVRKDVVSVALDHPNSVTLVFASHKRPGGGYLNHERGQEEYIARRSDLVERLQPYLGYQAKHAGSLEEGEQVPVHRRRQGADGAAVPGDLCGQGNQPREVAGAPLDGTDDLHVPLPLPDIGLMGDEVRRRCHISEQRNTQARCGSSPERSSDPLARIAHDISSQPTESWLS